MTVDYVRASLIVVTIIALGIGAVAAIWFDQFVSILTYPTLVMLEVFGQLILYGVLLLFLVFIYRLGKQRVTTTAYDSAVPDRNRPIAVPSPGDDLVRMIGDVRTKNDDVYNRVRCRLRQALRNYLIVKHGQSASLADSTIEEGRWTDDARSASVLAEDLEPGNRLSLRRILSFIEPPEVTARRNLRRAMRTVAQTVSERGKSTRLTRNYRINSRRDHVSLELGHIKRRTTGRWNGITALAFLGLILGVLYVEPSLLIIGAVGIGYAAYAQTGNEPTPTLIVERTISNSAPKPGDVVEVSVTVQNIGESKLYDLRLIDGVPDALGVTEGHHAVGTALAPDESITWSYIVEVRYGRHRFDPIQVISRSLTGSLEVETTVAPIERTEIISRPRPSPVEVIEEQPQTGSDRIGAAPAMQPGAGIEFHSIREYRYGDPVTTIDWHRYARTRERTTVQYHEDREQVVVIGIDARRAAYLSPNGSDDTHVLDRSVVGAASVFDSMARTGQPVGLVSIGPVPISLAPASGHRHSEIGLHLLSTHEGFGPIPPANSGYILDVIDRLPPGPSTLYLFSPLCDDEIIDIIDRLADRIEIKIIAPDPTHGRTEDGVIAMMERRARIATLRRDGISVTDWMWNDPIPKIGGPR